MWRALQVTLLCLAAGVAWSAPLVNCPAGMPIGTVSLNLERRPGQGTLPLNRVNRLDEGDKIIYAPVTRAGEKRPGKVTVVMVARRPRADEKYGFEVLEPKPAEASGEWKVPFPSALAVFVYGPSGISVGKVRGFLARDEDLVGQLADYAEKTAQTEQLLQALAAYETAGASENLNAALQGFARNYGVYSRVDRNAPLEQQTLAVIRNLNPALSTYDPITPNGQARLSQTAGLATIVAGMFFGSTVGLAAGSTAMAMNMKTILFPNSDFRSLYAQPVDHGTALCGKREGAQGRTRLVYLWAMRAPSETPPKIAITGMNHVPERRRSLVQAQVEGGAWALVGRARNWRVVDSEGRTTPVSVVGIADRQRLEIDFGQVGAGSYRLEADWDWDRFDVEGEIHVHQLPEFSGVKPTPASQNRLRQKSGKQVVTLTGSDFEFVEKVTLVRRNDRYGTPLAVPFTLPAGARSGVQESIEMEIDTTQLVAGEYVLQFYQGERDPREAPLRILPDPPKPERLPVRVNAGERERSVELVGERLELITGLRAEGLELELGPPGGRGRQLRLRSREEWRQGAQYDVVMEVEGYGEPLVLKGAIVVVGPRPRIREARVSPPANLPVAVKAGELPAGVYSSVLLEVEHAGASAAAEVGCEDAGGGRVRAGLGQPRDGVKLEAVQPGSYYLSFDAGRWPNGCSLAVTIDNGEGVSNPRVLGRVVRTPKIENFRLTDEAVGEGRYAGILEGRDLELIERVGWDAENGVEVGGLPTPLAGESYRQQLRVTVKWPSPKPHAPLWVWLRGETEGRATNARY